MRSVVVVGLLGMVTLAGCSGMSAAQVGQTAGAIAGSAIAPGPGTTLGALVGTLAGLVLDEQLDKTREQKERVELGHQLQTTPEAEAVEQPAAGQPTRVWVDEHVKHGRLLAGHFEVRNIP